MKASAIVGKTVKAVNQKRRQMNTGTVWDVTSIEFTDGTHIAFFVIEGEDDYAVDTTAWKNGKKIG